MYQYTHAYMCMCKLYLNVLRLGQLHEHLGCRVEDVHLAQDCCSIVRDDDLHAVHMQARPEIDSYDAAYTE